MEQSTARWAVASFLAGVAVLAVLALPLVAVCTHGAGQVFRHAFVAVSIVVVGCLLAIVVVLDLFAEHARRDDAAREAAAPRRPGAARTSS